MMIINKQEYTNKVLGCWMGKNIGGTLGAPLEWHRQMNDVNYYLQELQGNPEPNDDLDIQLLWLIALEEQGVDIDAKILGDYWAIHLTPYWAEYGISKMNMKAGLVPPLSGTTNNPFKDSCGSYIRSEIWACIAPGCPRTAVEYAYEDAIIDHGNGEGMYAELFCAALESAAFVQDDMNLLIDIGLSYIPEDCAVAKAIRFTRNLYQSGKRWQEARNEILRNFYGGFHFSVSEEDKKSGLGEGQVGWEVPANIALVILGLLYGEGDFDKTLCITVNCGEDTDCTAATVGAIMGIIQGINALPEKWIKPIGHSIQTMCLNTGDLQSVPATIEELTCRVEKIAEQVILRRKLTVALSDRETNLTDCKSKDLFADERALELLSHLNGPVYHFGFYDIYVDYGEEGAIIKDGAAKKIEIRIKNKYRITELLEVRWYAPEGWHISKASYALVNMQHDYSASMSTDYFNGCKTLVFELSSERITSGTNRFVVEVTVQGRAGSMLIPIVLLSQMY